MILIQSDRYLRSMSVKIAATQIASTMQFLESQFKKYSPQRDFNASFVDDLFNEQYAAEEGLAEISKIFAIIAILIACLGLLGLVTFSLQQRAKEISIRKVLGASVINILFMVSKKYLTHILISFVMAVPIAYYFMHDWLNTFEYRISIGLDLFLLAGIFAALLALGTIWVQALKFALSSPTKWLSRE